MQKFFKKEKSFLPRGSFVPDTAIFLHTNFLSLFHFTHFLPIFPQGINLKYNCCLLPSLSPCRGPEQPVQTQLASHVAELPGKQHRKVPQMMVTGRSGITWKPVERVCFPSYLQLHHIQPQACFFSKELKPPNFEHWEPLSNPSNCQ